MAEGFFGGFAQGFSSAYGRGMQDKRLREQLGYDQQRLDWQKTQGEQQLEISKQTLEQQKAYQGGELRLRQQDFTRQQAQDAALVEHQKYSDYLQGKQVEILQEKQKLDSINSMQKAIFTSGLTENQRKATAMGYMLANKIDPKSEAGKQFMLLTVDPQVTDEQRAEAGSLITNYLADLPPPAVNYLFDKFHNTPTLLIDAVTKLRAQKDAAQLKEVADSTSSTGRRWMPQGEAAHMEAPAPARLYASPGEAEDVKLFSEVRKSLFDEAQKGQAMKPMIGMLNQAIDKGDFMPGALGDIRKTLAQWAEFAGIPPDKTGLGSASTAEAMQSAAKLIGLNFASSLARATNMQVGFVQDALQSLSKTATGNKVINELMTQSIDQQTKMSDMAEEDARYRADNEGKPPPGPTLQQRLMRFQQNNPVIDDKFLARIQSEMAKGKAAPNQGIDWGRVFSNVEEGVGVAEKAISGSSEPVAELDAYPVLKTPADVDALKPGTMYRWSDGKLYKKRAK